MSRDTIFALATARGKAGVAIVRLSGPDAHDAIRRLTGDLPQPRRAALRDIRSHDGEVLDRGLILVFPDGQSFTGEASAELQLHGSVAVVDAVLRELSGLSGLRMAEPGEFTRRALDNERLDLTQVEGLADLVGAETDAQRRQAQRVLSGALGEKVERWRADLTRAAALLEATIDFADEDVPTDVTPEVLELLDRVTTDIRSEHAGSRIAERIRDGFEVAIVGPPNIGKSTLLNALAGRDAAITSETAGTTRDVIEVRMDLAGLPVTLLDTAGLRETTDAVEAEGVERGRRRADRADLRVFLVENEAQIAALEMRADDIALLGKGDLAGGAARAISGKTGMGVDHLVSHVTEVLSRRALGVGSAVRHRHRVALEEGLTSLESARAQVLSGAGSVEFAAEDLRAVVRALESLTGRIGVESLLDVIFSSFCLGK
ncbi:tRNA uridine-5-carboxymethylaminomethyl(34) synthesis GTPase MnmE [Oceaniglobus roseus]|uniref:tRNA uridine-5-carboxymethylaminomethyl(34) synthesis GTPase MnmE n=1 Tax=Oceaniglobus roseus TaxID=1737570 RepID=UPI000C7EF47B|nr:tRNA uridine-5-carboxymethylaminomethyl(34) synthesis GTPase MnmE [Kandeliimicrobium roseum]